MRKQARWIVAALAVILGVPAAAQDWRTKPVIVENKTGAGSMIGSEAVARAAPDGDTLLMTSASPSNGPALFGRHPYDWRKDFAFITAVSFPPLVALFSHTVEVDGSCFVTGQMPTDPHDDSKPLPPDIEGQTVRVMENLKIVLAGLGLEHVIVARVYITDFEANYPRMNAIHASYLPIDRRPARTSIGVTGRARGGMVEIDLLAKR
jgi:enamine deaminase RidA (YjgF/YER057c/UK114 family)